MALWNSISGQDTPASHPAPLGCASAPHSFTHPLPSIFPAARTRLDDKIKLFQKVY